MITVARLHSGMSFGELALIKDQPRAASIICDTDCHFAVLSKEDYMSIIGKIEARKLDDFIQFLQEIPMFRLWTKKKLEVLTYHFKSIIFKRKQIVFNINVPLNCVYIVKSGEFEIMKPVVSQNTKKSPENYMMKIALLGKGEVLGDEEVIKNKNTSFICACYSTIGELLSIKAEDFLLKVQSGEHIKEFNAKSRSKNMLRNPRIKNFREFLINHKFIQPQEDKQIVTIPAQNSPVRNITRKISPKPRESQTLTKEIIQNIKKTALGKSDVYKRYMSFSSPLELSTRYHTSSDLSSSKRSKTPSLILKPMKIHRPGGYYRANLKKSFAG